MNIGLIAAEIRKLEMKMWEAFAYGDSNTFSNIVSDEAMMICGGSRESGYEYSKIVTGVRLDKYEISDFIVKEISPNTVLTNYIVKVQCPYPDIDGTFRVSSLWIKTNMDWELVFNQDSKLV